VLAQGEGGSVASATFSVKFKNHLPAKEVSNLKGILCFDGIGKDENGTFVLVVSRPGRASFTAITLNNWTALGWLTWASEPTLVPYERELSPRPLAKDAFEGLRSPRNSKRPK
jgi:hypothetical protein